MELSQIYIYVTITLGFGSVLSPSGDEEGSTSDQESLRSPLSCKGSHDYINNFDDDTLSSSPAPTDGETDFIDVDLPSPSHENNKGMLSLPPPRVPSTTTKEGQKKKVAICLCGLLFWADMK